MSGQPQKCPYCNGNQYRHLKTATYEGAGTCPECGGTGRLDPVTLRAQLAAAQAENERLADELTKAGIEYGEICEVIEDWGRDDETAAEAVLRLRAIIAKLPKCWGLNDAGKLVCDVPVLPGMEVWLLDEGAGPDEGFVSADEVEMVWSTGQVELRWSNANTITVLWPPSTCCYDTREAAIVAASANAKAAKAPAE